MYNIYCDESCHLENDNQKRISDASLTRKELKKLKRKNKTPIILKCHIFKDEKGLCFISGSSNDKEKENIQRITTQLNNKLLPDLIKDLYNYYDENKIKKGIAKINPLLFFIYNKLIVFCIFFAIAFRFFAFSYNCAFVFYRFGFRN